MFDLYFKLSSLEFIFRLFEFKLISSFDARSEPVIDISLVEFIFICLAFRLDLFELVCFKELSCLVVARSALTPTLKPYVPELARAAAIWVISAKFFAFTFSVARRMFSLKYFSSSLYSSNISLTSSISE